MYATLLSRVRYFCSVNVVKSPSFYQRMNSKYPIITQACVGFILLGTGDIVRQQVVAKHGRHHNVYQTLWMALIGFCYVGPLLRYWYAFLDRNILSTGFRGAAYKAMTDQIVFSPLFLASMINLLKRPSSLQESRKLMTNEYIKVLKTNYKIWPFVQLLTFSVIPPSYRIIFVNTIAIGWNTYISYTVFGNNK